MPPHPTGLPLLGRMPAPRPSPQEKNPELIAAQRLGTHAELDFGLLRDPAPQRARGVFSEEAITVFGGILMDQCNSTGRGARSEDA
jgi:hypothetical protein